MDFKISDFNSKDAAFTSFTINTPPPSTCGVPFYFGDGYCDDENNNEGSFFVCCLYSAIHDFLWQCASNSLDCGFDGGDCCGEHVKTDFCSACKCLEVPNATEHQTISMSP